MTFDPWTVVTMSLMDNVRVTALIVSHEEADTVMGHRHLICVKFCDKHLAMRFHVLDSIDHRVDVPHPDGHFRFALDPQDVGDIQPVPESDPAHRHATNSPALSAHGFAGRWSSPPTTTTRRCSRRCRRLSV